MAQSVLIETERIAIIRCTSACKMTYSDDKTLRPRFLENVVAHSVLAAAFCTASHMANNVNADIIEVTILIHKLEAEEQTKHNSIKIHTESRC